RGALVAEELRAPVGTELRLVLHVPPAAGQERDQRHGEDGRPHGSTSETSCGPRLRRKLRVRSASNFGSLASMQMKKRSLVARAKVGTLKTGWYGSGSPLRASMPSTAVSAANRIVVSKVGGMKDTQLWNGRPPMFIGYSITDAQYWSP